MELDKYSHVQDITHVCLEGVGSLHKTMVADII